MPFKTIADAELAGHRILGQPAQQTYRADKPWKVTYDPTPNQDFIGRHFRRVDVFWANWPHGMEFVNVKNGRRAVSIYGQCRIQKEKDKSA